MKIKYQNKSMKDAGGFFSPIKEVNRTENRPSGFIY